MFETDGKLDTALLGAELLILGYYTVLVADATVKRLQSWRLRRKAQNLDLT